MNKTQHRKEMNHFRFEILEGHGTLVIADHFKHKLIHYEFLGEEENVDTHDKIENAYLTNGWKHLRNVEESLS